MTDQVTSGEKLRLERIKQVAETLRDRPFFVSTIRASLTHGFAFLMFHDGDCPLLGQGLLIAGMSTFEGEVLKSGPHRFIMTEQGSDRKQYALQSEDGRFRVIAEKFVLVEKTSPVYSQLEQWDGVSVSDNSH